jgi:peroxin-11B
LHGEKHKEKDLGLEADRETRLRVIAASVSLQNFSPPIHFIFYRTRAAVRHQFIIDMLDLWNPATSLGLSNLNDGVVGIFGSVSSFPFSSHVFNSTRVVLFPL